MHLAQAFSNRAPRGASMTSRMPSGWCYGLKGHANVVEVIFDGVITPVAVEKLFLGNFNSEIRP